LQSRSGVGGRPTGRSIWPRSGAPRTGPKRSPRCRSWRGRPTT